jgi:hypothetical protein
MISRSRIHTRASWAEPGPAYFAVRVAGALASPPGVDLGDATPGTVAAPASPTTRPRSVDTSRRGPRRTRPAVKVLRHGVSDRTALAHPFVDQITTPVGGRPPIGSPASWPRSAGVLRAAPDGAPGRCRVPDKLCQPADVEGHRQCGDRRENASHGELTAGRKAGPTMGSANTGRALVTGPAAPLTICATSPLRDCSADLAVTVFRSL